MTPERIAALAVLGLRVGYGAALIAAPARTTRSWLGPVGERDGAQVAIRGVGAREIAVHTAGIVAVLRDAPVRPWLAASFAGDVSDIAATAAASDIPDDAAKKTAVVAGISALLTAAVAAALDR